MQINTLTGKDNHLEDVFVGDVLKQMSSKPLEQIIITYVIVNKTPGNIDKEVMKSLRVGERLTFDGVNLPLSVDMPSHGSAENAISELSMQVIRVQGSVFHGRTMTASTEAPAAGPAERKDTDSSASSIAAFNKTAASSSKANTSC